MEIEYTVETTRGDVTSSRRLTINDPSELAIERMIDRAIDDLQRDVVVNITENR